ncbi:MAG: hypothetical protein ACF8SC_12350 [Phycisphaerales bacterium JB037]
MPIGRHDIPAVKGPPRPKGHPFEAEMDAADLDDRRRPGPTFIVRGIELSRSHVVISSRRMCYVGREVLLAVHLVDNEPMGLMGRVVSCDYAGIGCYRIDIDLQELPKEAPIREWLCDLGRRDRAA